MKRTIGIFTAMMIMAAAVTGTGAVWAQEDAVQEPVISEIVGEAPEIPVSDQQQTSEEVPEVQTSAAVETVTFAAVQEASAEQTVPEAEPAAVQETVVEEAFMAAEPAAVPAAEAAEPEQVPAEETAQVQGEAQVPSVPESGLSPEIQEVSQETETDLQQNAEEIPYGEIPSEKVPAEESEEQIRNREEGAVTESGNPETQANPVRTDSEQTAPEQTASVQDIPAQPESAQTVPQQNVPEQTEAVQNTQEQGSAEQTASEQTSSEQAASMHAGAKNPAGQQTQTGRTESEKIRLKVLPLQLKTQLTQTIGADSRTTVSVELKNITNRTLEQIELTLWSEEDGFYFEPYEQFDPEKLPEEEKDKVIEKSIRIASLRSGETVKTNLVIVSEQEILPDRDVKVKASCDCVIEDRVFTAQNCSWELFGQEETNEEETQESELIFDPEELVLSEEETETGGAALPEEGGSDQQDEAADLPDGGDSDQQDEETDLPEGGSDLQDEAADLSGEGSDLQDEEAVVSDVPEDQNSEDDEMVIYNAAGEEQNPEGNDGTQEGAEAAGPADEAQETADTAEASGDETEDSEEYVYDDYVTYYYGDDYTSAEYINTVTPHVIVYSYSHKRKVYSGDTFTVEITLLNTSKSLAMDGVMAKIETSDGIGLANGTNTIFINDIPAGGTAVSTITLTASPEVKEQTQTITLALNYEYVENRERKQGQASETVSLPVYQKDRLEIKDPVCDAMEEGAEGVISLSYINKGLSQLYNMEAVLSLENADAVQTTVYAGNVESGKNGSLDFIVIPYTAGDCDGTVTVTYEDASQKESSVEIPVHFPVQAAYYEEEFSLDDFALEEESAEQKEAALPVIPIAAGACAAAASGVIVILRNRKKARVAAQEEEEDDWFSAD